MENCGLPYNPTQIDSIVEYAEDLVGHTLREKTSAPELQSPKQRRGSFGNALEEYFFDYKPNSDSSPDPSKSRELRTTGDERSKSPAFRSAEPQPCVILARSVIRQVRQTRAP